MRKTGKILFIGLLGSFLAIKTALPLAVDFLAQAQAQESGLKRQPEKFGELSKHQQIDRLFEKLKKAHNELAARKVENQIWEIWMALPDDLDLREMMQQAMSARRSYSFERAIELLDQVVMRAPQYSEGWNQRAFVFFLQEKFDASLEDLEKALAIEPRHFGALTGKARIFIFQGRFEKAQALLRRAVKIHPFIQERSLIVEPKKIDL